MKEVFVVKLLLIIGAGIFVLPGASPAFFTFQDLIEPRNFTPRNPELRAAMQEANVAFHPKINLWQSWLGFHFSHCLGLLMFGGAFLYIGIFYPSVFSELKFLQVCFVLITAIYVIISVKFWFLNPAIFAGISMACFVLAVVFANV